MLPVLTGVRIEIDGSTISLLATDRFRLSPPRARAGTRAPPTSPLAALVPAKVLGDTAKSLTAGSEVTIALAAGGTGEGIIGFEGAAAGGVRRTTTRLLDGEFPKVRSLFPSRAPDRGHGRQGRADRVGQARRPGRRAQHRGPAGLQRRRAHPRRRLRRRGPGLGVDRGDIDGEDITTGFNPQFLLDGLTAIDEAVVELAFTQASKPVVISGVDRRRRAEDAGVPLPADAAPPAVLTRHRRGSRPTASPRRVAHGHRTRRTRQDGRQHARPGCATPATPSSATTATPTSPTSAASRSWSRQLPSPQGGLGDGAGRRPDPRDRHASSASCSARATSSSTAATPAGPTTRPTPSCSPRRASASSTAASPAASGASRTATP